MQSRAAALAHRVETRQRRAAVEVRGHAAHRVVSGRRDSHWLAGGIDPRGAQRGHDVGEAGEVDLSHVEQDGAALAKLGLDRESHLVAWRQLGHEALAILGDQLGPLAPYGLGDEEAVMPVVRMHEGGGMELHELDVGEICARRMGKSHPYTGGAARVGRAPPERRRPAGGEHGAASGQRAAATVQVLGEHTDAAAVVHPQAACGRTLEHLHLVVQRGERREVACDPATGGTATRVCHAAARVTTLEA